MRDSLREATVKRLALYLTAHDLATIQRIVREHSLAAFMPMRRDLPSCTRLCCAGLLRPFAVYPIGERMPEYCATILATIIFAD